MSIKESAMVINLSISQWTARKYDAKVSQEVETIHQAKEAGRFNKLLLQSETLKEISKIATKARTFHYENTLPWGDNGDRLLPCEKYFEYITAIGTLKMEYLQATEKFIAEYAEEKEKAKIRLNTMYKEVDYPREEEIQKKFNILVSFFPIAESNDLRVNLSENVLKTIKSQITQEVNSRVEKATTEILQRIKDAVQHIVETLKDPEKIFRDSLIGNLESLIENAPLLNFNKDSRVDEAINLCKPLIVSPDRLRWYSDFRKEIAKKAEQIYNEL